MLSGKKVIVIGGLGGIGTEICKSLLENGVEKLGIIDMQERLTSDFEGNSLVSYTKCSVDNREELRKAFENFKISFNGIDMAINSAGIVDESNYERAFSVNTFGVINFTVIATDLMRQDKTGSGGIIINIASTLGYLSYQGFPIYVATKHAVLGFLKSIVEPKICELTGLQFITICPGYTNTRLIGSSVLHELALEAQGEPFPPQSPAVVSECLLESLKSTKYHSFWRCLDGKINEIELLTATEI